ncbi:DUF402 domain-containing protein [Streptomyces sp. RKAG337]|uniref:DUF402 domain-containing protein n=1 Tax=Streptomyces sp. RKAG337 TaxID=2893404 RepID=UPI00203466C9|nr:DUF402 domain-containing protein [Streptomyces sp. RKAG337]MCM2429297.1 DUF402 domain-containing protein [Streptomyces sp. RKAG337]
MSDDVRVEYRKYDGSLHWNMAVHRLGEDEHGVWLGAPADSVMRKGHGPEVPCPEAQVLLFPRQGWWTAAFNAAPRSTEIYCDITTPPEWRSASLVTMVDLDLDVIRKRGKPTPLLVDEDEFAEHQVRYGYPADVIEQAAAAAQWLMRQVGDGAEPFTTVYRSWLAHVE